MKIYLDDERQAPKGWVRTSDARSTINILKRGLVSHLSLDHDLGEETGIGYPIGCGYDVLLWIEEQVHTNPDFILPEIKIHTANPSARTKMELGLKSIKKHWKKNAST